MISFFPFFFFLRDIKKKRKDGKPRFFELKWNFDILFFFFLGFDGFAPGQSEAFKAIRQREKMGHHMRSSE